MSENDNNRSSAMTPELLAAINTATQLSVQTAVQEAIKSVFAGIMPVLKDMAITPEKLREGMRPYVDPALLKRQLRESLKSKADEEEMRKSNRLRMDACPHLDKNGRSSISLVHNQPDHQPRGICVVCSDWIHPREWRFGPPTEEFPRGKAYIADAHKNYATVLQLESMN